MHFSMLACGLLALASASTIAAQACSNTFLSIGQECAPTVKEGDYVCDSSYRNIVSHVYLIIYISPSPTLTPPTARLP